MAKSRRGISFRDYIEKRKEEDAAFAEGYDEGFHKFKMGVMLKMARKDAKMTQAEVAEKMGTTQSSTISLCIAVCNQSLCSWTNR